MCVLEPMHVTKVRERERERGRLDHLHSKALKEMLLLLLLLDMCGGDEE